MPRRSDAVSVSRLTTKKKKKKKNQRRHAGRLWGASERLAFPDRQDRPTVQYSTVQ